jgi:hypothetical protein
MTVLRFSAGTMLGWLCHPACWIVAGPFRWLALMLGSIAQESGYNSNAAADIPSGGQSLGVAQFILDTWYALGGEGKARNDDFWSGWYSAAYVQSAIIEDMRWVSIAVPVYGYAVLRYLWTHGEGSADEIWSEAWAYKGYGGADGDADNIVEANAWPAFLFWRSLTLLPAVYLSYLLIREVKKRTGSR